MPDVICANCKRMGKERRERERENDSYIKNKAEGTLTHDEGQMGGGRDVIPLCYIFRLRRGKERQKACDISEFSRRSGHEILGRGH